MSRNILDGAVIGQCSKPARQFSAVFRQAHPGLFNMAFGAYGMPVGICLCVINGASLFTSNVAYLAAAVLERRATVPQATWALLLSYFANIAGGAALFLAVKAYKRFSLPQSTKLASCSFSNIVCMLACSGVPGAACCDQSGSLFIAQVMILGDVFLHHTDFTIEGNVNIGSFKAVFVKSIMANWLLCMAVWQATAAQDVTGKLLGVLFPVSAYVTMGLEHCIANCFLYPLAMKLGTSITIKIFMANVLVPSTLGNIEGGGCFVAVAYSLAYGTLEQKVRGRAQQLHSRALHSRFGCYVSSIIEQGTTSSTYADGTSTNSSKSNGDKANLNKVASLRRASQLTEGSAWPTAPANTTSNSVVYVGSNAVLQMVAVRNSMAPRPLRAIPDVAGSSSSSCMSSSDGSGPALPTKQASSG